MSKRRAFILAVKALAAAALPGVAVRGFDGDAVRPEKIPAGGCIIGHPGSPGEPVDVILGVGPIYDFEHALHIELLPGLAEADPAAQLDQMITALSDAVVADRTLGGAVDWADVSGGDEDDLRLEGSLSARWGRVIVTGNYSASSPLGD